MTCIRTIDGRVCIPADAYKGHTTWRNEVRLFDGSNFFRSIVCESVEEANRVASELSDSAEKCKTE